jgi:hypothetical protein
VLSAFLLALLALALVPAGATATRTSAQFRLTYTGSGSYGVDLVSPEGLRGHVSADFHWRIAYRPAPLGNGIVEWQRGKATGSGSWSMSSEADNCSQTGALALKGDGGGLLDLQRGVLEVIVFPEEGDFSSTSSTGSGGACASADFWRQWVTGFSQVGSSDGVDPLTSHLSLPKGKIRQRGGIRVRTSNETPTFPSLAPAPSCGFSEIGSCIQSFSWHAVVSIKPVEPGASR